MNKTGNLSPISISSTTYSATKVSMAPTTPEQKILRKTGMSKKQNKRKQTKKKTNEFYPKMKVFHNTGKILYLMKTILCHTQSCKLNLHSSKRHTDMARKRDQPFERLKMPRKFPIDNE